MKYNHQRMHISSIIYSLWPRWYTQFWSPPSCK